MVTDGFFIETKRKKKLTHSYSKLKNITITIRNNTFIKICQIVVPLIPNFSSITPQSYGNLMYVMDAILVKKKKKIYKRIQENWIALHLSFRCHINTGEQEIETCR